MTTTEMTALQSLLLQACFSDDTAAWQSWREAVDIDHLDSHSQWLLPLLYRRLDDLEVEHSLLLRYRNVYLHNWYKNHLLLRRLRDIALAFQSIPYVMSTGLSLLICCYKDVGVRPIHRAEFLIPDWCLRNLLHTLRRSAIDYEWLANGDIRLLAGAHVPMTVSAKWSVLPAGWWRRLETAEYNGVRVRRLNRDDMFAYMIAERNAWDDNSSLLWWADLLTFSRSAGIPASARPPWPLADESWLSDAYR